MLHSDLPHTYCKHDTKNEWRHETLQPSVSPNFQPIEHVLAGVFLSSAQKPLFFLS